MKDGRSLVVHVRLTEDEKLRISDDAQAAGLSMSAYTRKRVLGHPIISRSDMVMVNELRRQGGLLKLAMATNAVDKVAGMHALKLIIDTVKEFGYDRQKD